LSTRW